MVSIIELPSVANWPERVVDWVGSVLETDRFSSGLRALLQARFYKLDISGKIDKIFWYLSIYVYDNLSSTKKLFKFWMKIYKALSIIYYLRPRRRPSF